MTHNQKPLGSPTVHSSRSTEFVYGRRPVLEVLKAGKRSLHKLWIAEGSHGIEEVLQLARELGVPFTRTSRSALDRMVPGHHQGVVAQASATQFLELDSFLGQISPQTEAVVVALDEIDELLEQPVGSNTHDGVCLGRKMEEEGSLRDAGNRRDVGDRRIVVTLSREQGECGRAQALSGLCLLVLLAQGDLGWGRRRFGSCAARCGGNRRPRL